MCEAGLRKGFDCNDESCGGIERNRIAKARCGGVSGGKANHSSEMRGHGNDYRSVGEAKSSIKQQRLRNDRPGLRWHCTDKRSEGKAVTGIDMPRQVGVLIRKGIAWQSEACQGKGKAKRI